MGIQRQAQPDFLHGHEVLGRLAGRNRRQRILLAKGGMALYFQGCCEPGTLRGCRGKDLWCYAVGARRKGERLPEDLNWSVLYERRYAFEWLDGMQDWDDVTCDA
jgi:hypothetical protein